MKTSNTESWSETTYFAIDDSARWGDDPLMYYDPKFKDFCLAELEDISKLAPGWDDEEAVAIDKDIVDSARTLINSLPRFIAPRPMIVPLSNGSLQLEWQRGEAVLELEFEDAQTLHYLKWKPSRQTEEEDLIDVNDVDKVVELIRWFTKAFFDG